MIKELRMFTFTILIGFFLTQILISPALIYDPVIEAVDGLVSKSVTNLTLNGGSLTLTGNRVFNNVEIMNGSTLYVGTYNGSSESGWLNITANNIIVDSTSMISADNKGSGGGTGGIPPSGSGSPGSGLGGGGGGSKANGGVGTGGSGGGSFSGLFGSGGGGGGAYTDAAGASGGAGGGGIILQASNIEIYGILSANGESGWSAGVNGAGGGGAGGLIRINCTETLTIEGSLRANGGSGGNGPNVGQICGGNKNGAGGGGGGAFTGFGGNGRNGATGTTGGGGGKVEINHNIFYEINSDITANGGSGGSVCNQGNPGQAGGSGLITIDGNTRLIDLIVNGTSINLSGKHAFRNVLVVNGGVIGIDTYNGSVTSGWLNITADHFLVDSTSQIDGSLKGLNGYTHSGSQGGSPGPCAHGTGGSGGSGGIPVGDRTSRSNFDMGSAGGNGGKGGDGYWGQGCGQPGANGGAGQLGGAGIRIKALKIDVHGTINSNGGVGGNGGKGGDCPCGTQGAGGGGGGGGEGASGGTILVDGNIVNITSAFITANGGNGGGGGAGGYGICTSGYPGSAGGQGAGGRVKIFYGVLENSSTIVSVFGGNLGTIYFEQIGPVHDIAITDVEPSSTDVITGEIVWINVTIENQGSEPESFNVSAIALGPESYNENQEVFSLNSSEIITLSYEWNTFNYLEGVYILTAEAEILANETDVIDNFYTDGNVTIRTMPIADFSYSPIDPVVNETMTFNASSSTPDGGVIINYRWDFGDGNISVTGSPIITHIYPFASIYNVTLTITDSEGLNDTIGALVEVSIRDLVIIDISPSAHSVTAGDIVFVGIVVENQGTKMEVFNITAFANSTLIGNLTDISLNNGSITMEFIPWDTTDVLTGNYTISGNVTILPKEMDIRDNNFTNGVVEVFAYHDISIVNLTKAKTFVGQELCFNISLTLSNEGDYSESFYVLIYMNTTQVANVTVNDLVNGDIITLELKCMAPAITLGNYTISAFSYPVTGESDLYDNTFIDETIQLTIPGDVDGDCDVDIFDIVKIGAIYGLCEGDPRFDPNLDLDCDSCIRIFDVVIAAGHYKETCS